ncbi:MAG: lamin tail domain-containing protein [Candidatus Nealsonbacteria bacterium]|nr:lamin tail domain-containing protein [Candidatus Nealsonbacteria bacterium]
MQRLKRKRQNKRNKDVMKTAIVKLAAILVIIALNWSGLSAVIETIAYYFDNEGDGGNTFTAATLDFSLTAGSWSGTPSEMKTGDSVEKQITVNNSGSLGFQYNVIAVKTSGNSDFCDALDVVAKRNSVQLYSDSLLGLTITPPVVYESSSIDVWDFTVSLPSGSFPMESCGFKFVFTGWQTDFIDASSGFSDIEEDANTFIGAQGQACDPDDVTLPTDFDQAYWIDKANDGGVVEGSFVFPSGTTGLQLGPTEIIGDLTFGQNNGATIKGPIYVHGDLDIASGTTITQDSSFGDNFVTIIVDGTITIGDNVVFNGSGTTGAFLLVASSTIDVAARVTGDGNLGDAVLFATHGNIHIGANRTVLDAFVTILGSSGNTSLLPPSANVNSGWTTPENAYVSDNARARGETDTDIVQYHTFSFPTITTGATITGIEVQVEGYKDDDRDADISLSWNGGTGYTTGTGLKRTNMPVGSSIEAVRVFGGLTDTWNRTWASGDFTNSNFRMKLDTISAHSGYYLYIDLIQIKVYWSVAGQTITWDTGSTNSPDPFPSQVACGPMFMDLNQVVINEFVPNVPDTGISINTGLLSPSANSNHDWTYPENAYVSDNNWAVANDDNDIVQYYNFNLSVPTGATINGIEVQVEGYNTGGSTPRQADISLSWNNGSSYTSGSGTGLKRTNMPGTISSAEDVRIFGGSSDTWGRSSWSIGEFTNANFRVKLDSISANGTLNIDQVQVRVYYTIPAGSYGTGVKSPSANVTDTGDGWVNPTNAYADDGTPPATDNQGDKQQYYNFGYNIPTMATIDGIVVSADAMATVSGTNTGLFAPSAYVNPTNWSSPENIYTSNNSRASADSDSDENVDYYNFGLPTIPAGATISGVEVQVEGYRDCTGWFCSATRQANVSLSWDAGLSYTTGSGVKITSVPNDSETVTSLGGDSDSWNRTWSPSDFAGANFRLRLNENNGAGTLYIDHIQVRVYYTTAVAACQLGVDLSYDSGTNWTPATEKTTANLTGAEQTYTLGSASDTWGHSWTPAQINSSFRARVHSCTGGATTNLDWLRADVHYSISGEIGVPGGHSSDNGGEWVELYNGTGATVDVGGWALYDAENTHELLITSANTNTGGTTIPASGYLVVYRDGDADFDLDNTTDTVRLYNDQITTGGTLVDSHYYNYVGGAPENKSFARIPDGTANWLDPEPTPGESNNMFVVPYVEEIEEPEITEEENLIPEEEIILEEEQIIEEEPIDENNEEELATEENQEEGIVGEINDTIEEMVSGLFEEIIPDEATNEEPATEEISVVDETSPVEETPVTEEQPVIEENAPVIEEQPVTTPENTAVESAAPEAGGGDGVAGNEAETVSE